MKIQPEKGQHFVLVLDGFCGFTVIDPNTQQLFEVQLVTDKLMGESAIAVTPLDNFDEFRKQVIRAKLKVNQ